MRKKKKLNWVKWVGPLGVLLLIPSLLLNFLLFQKNLEIRDLFMI